MTFRMHVFFQMTIFSITEDAVTKLTRMLYDPQFKMADRERYLTETMPLWLGYFENLAPPLAKQVILLLSTCDITKIPISTEYVQSCIVNNCFTL